ncbi:hypothetical protein QBC44DRAFT_315551 [Cladorrhinum sp. PSN332]|nr:hypothetical protein QBC44DRAFT_315551 [Cladorrhinum sp. PSN332]
MSADLFAAFGDPPATSSSAPQQNQAKSKDGGEITTFPSFDLSASQPQTLNNNPPSQPSSLYQNLLSSQAASWNTPSNPNVWGDLGGLGGFQSQTTAPPVAQKPTQLQNDDEDEDGWGDFETATPVNPPYPPAPVSSTVQPRTRVLRASTIELMSNKLFDLDIENSVPQPFGNHTTKQQPPQKPARNPDPDVLFDADFEAENDLDEDDDFGEFEDVAAPPPAINQAPPPVKPSQDLFSLDFDPAPPKKQPPGLSLSNAALTSNPLPYPQAPKSPYGSSFQDRKPELVKALQVKPVAGIKDLKEANQASPSPVTAWPGADEGFGSKWEPFEDEPVATKPTTATTKPAVTKPLAKSKPPPKPTPAPSAAADWEWQDWGESPQPTPSVQIGTSNASQPSITNAAIPDLDAPSGPPPTNIPPPSVLLSLFPSLLDLANTSLLKPLLTLSPSSPGYQKILSSPQALTFLKGYLTLTTVAAHIIAGRKHRWHRDKFLSQSMSISAATGVKGMKLQGLDKTQAAREDREAGEVLEVWKKQVGRLRSVVAGVNGVHSGENLKVPELAMNMSVATAKGALADKKACVVCGLRREERVGKVDFEVEDSFGEWWIEFWGHRGCVNFWRGNEKELRGK